MTDTEFLKNIYDELLKVEAQLDVIVMSQYANEKLTQETEVKSAFTAAEVAKDHVTAIADNVDRQIYCRSDT